MTPSMEPLLPMQDPSTIQDTSSASPPAKADKQNLIGLLKAQGMATEHQIQRNFSTKLKEIISVIFSRQQPTPEKMEFKEKMKTAMGSLRSCEKEAKKASQDAKGLDKALAKTGHGVESFISRKIDQANKTIADIEALETSLRDLQEDPQTTPAVQKSLQKALDQCTSLKDKCTSSIKVNQAKSESSPEIEYDILENEHASEKKLTRIAQYFANTYDGKKATESMYTDSLLSGESLTIDNGLQGADKKTLTGEQQMFKDLGRTAITINGEALSDPKVTETGISKQFQVAEKLVAKFGEEGLKKFAPIMHQSLFADFHTELFNGRLNEKGVRTDPGLGYGAPSNILIIDYKKQCQTQLSDDQIFELLAPRFNIQENADGSITLTATMITGFKSELIEDEDGNSINPLGNTFCETTIEVTIPKEEFEKKDPKDMQLTVTAKCSEVLTSGYENIESFSKQQSEKLIKKMKAEAKKTSEKLATTSTPLVPNPTTSEKKATDPLASTPPVMSREELGEKCNRLLLLKDPPGVEPLTDEMMSTLASKAEKNPSIQKNLQRIFGKYEGGVAVIPKTTDRGVPQEGGGLKGKQASLHMDDYILIHQMIHEEIS